MTGMALGVGYHSLCGVLLLFARVDLDSRTEECSLYTQLNGSFKEYTFAVISWQSWRFIQISFRSWSLSWWSVLTTSIFALSKLCVSRSLIAKCSLYSSHIWSKFAVQPAICLVVLANQNVKYPFSLLQSPVWMYRASASRSNAWECASFEGILSRVVLSMINSLSTFIVRVLM